MENFKCYTTRSLPHMMLKFVKEQTTLPLQPGSCNISRLSLLAGVFTYTDVKTLIIACPRLKAFRYSSEGLGNNEYSSIVHPHEVLELLMPSTGTRLEELSLLLVESAGKDHRREFFRLLPKFTYLQRLEINTLALFEGVPEYRNVMHRLCAAIPPSLEQLHLCSEVNISWNSKRQKAQMKALIENMPLTLHQFLIYTRDKTALETLPGIIASCQTGPLDCRAVPQDEYLRKKFEDGKDTPFPWIGRREEDMSYYEKANQQWVCWRRDRYEYIYESRDWFLF